MKKIVLALLFAALLALPAFAGQLVIDEMEYDDGAVKVELRENGAFGDVNIQWTQKEKITLKDASGKVLPVQVVKYEHDEIKFISQGIVMGGRYSVTISDIPFKGQPCTVSGTFTAYDD